MNSVISFIQMFEFLTSIFIFSFFSGCLVYRKQLLDKLQINPDVIVYITGKNTTIPFILPEEYTEFVSCFQTLTKTKSTPKFIPLQDESGDVIVVNQTSFNALRPIKGRSIIVPVNIDLRYANS
jgi:hypothetical protein